MHGSAFTFLLVLAQQPGGEVPGDVAGHATVDEGHETVDWQSLPPDELIELLPDVDEEGWIDPATDRWIEHPAVTELDARIRDGLVLGSTQWVRALLVSGAIRWRPLWPSGQPFAISIRKPRWTGCGRIRVSPRTTALREATCGLMQPMLCGLAYDIDAAEALYFELGKLGLGDHDLVLDVTFEPSEFGGARDERPAPLQGRLPIRVKVVGDLDQVLPSCSDAEVELALRSLLRIRRARGTAREGSVYLQQGDAARKVMEEVAFPLELELVRRNRVVSTILTQQADLLFGTTSIDEPHLAYLRTLPPSSEGPERWTLRVRGVDRTCLSWWSATRRYTGRFEIPLSALID